MATKLTAEEVLDIIIGDNCHYTMDDNQRDTAIKAMQSFSSQQSGEEDGWIRVRQSQFNGMKQDMDMALEREKMYEKALRNLCHLKRWKDEHGKDIHYERSQPEAWAYAFSLMERFKVWESPYSETDINKEP